MYANIRSTMVICVLLRRLNLTAALGQDLRALLTEPVALSPEPGREQVVDDTSPSAEAFGIVRGMRVGEAHARCPGLRLVPPDPEASRAYWGGVLDRLEGMGAATESDDPGTAWFDADGLHGIHGGHLEGVLAATAKTLPAGVRLAAAPSRFTAYAAAMTARRRQRTIVPQGAERVFLAPMPVGLLRSRAGLEKLPDMLERLGVRTFGQLSSLPAPSVAERFGHPGLLALELAQGRDTRLEPRRPVAPVLERLTLPEAASGGQLERALEVVLARLLARRERRGRSLRSLALSARFVEGGTWRVSVTVRRPTAELSRLRLALGLRLGDLPAPAESLAVEVEAFGPPEHGQEPLVEDPGAVRRARLGEAVRHVRSGAGGAAVMRVLEVDPDSRLPERRATLVPFPEASE